MTSNTTCNNQGRKFSLSFFYQKSFSLFIAYYCFGTTVDKRTYIYLFPFLIAYQIALRTRNVWAEEESLKIMLMLLKRQDALRLKSAGCRLLSLRQLEG